MAFRFACLVEGHGEVEAVPVLVRRIAQELHPTEPVPVVSVFRVQRTKLLQVGELERRVEIAVRRVQPLGAVLILIDSDDDCPARLGPELLRRAWAVTSLPVGEEYGLARISAVLEQNGAHCAEALVAACLRDLRTFQAGAPRGDDLTLMAIQRLRPAIGEA